MYLIIIILASIAMQFLNNYLLPTFNEFSKVDSKRFAVANQRIFQGSFLEAYDLHFIIVLSLYRLKRILERPNFLDG